MDTPSSKKLVLEHLLQLPADEVLSLVVCEPRTAPAWLDDPSKASVTAPGGPLPRSASLMAQRSHWVLRTSVKHHAARTRLRTQLKRWPLTVADLAAEPGVQVTGCCGDLRSLLRELKHLDARLCDPGVVCPLEKKPTHQ